MPNTRTSKPVKLTTPAPVITPNTNAPSAGELERVLAKLAKAKYSANRKLPAFAKYDAEYLRFWDEHADKRGHVSVAKLIALHRNPYYSGDASASAYNAGYFSRLRIFGFVTLDVPNSAIVITSAGRAKLVADSTFSPRQANDARIGIAVEAPAENFAKFKYEGYWIFANAPHIWAIDKFLLSGVTEDTWGVDPKQQRHFKPGQLGFIRVGVDKRNKAQLEGRPKLRPGIYALCEVTSEVFAGHGANGGYWYGNGRVDGWPTVRVRYLRSYLHKPLLIETLKGAAPSVDHLVTRGFQASSFPITEATFHELLQLLGETADVLGPAIPKAPTTWHQLVKLEAKYANAAPDVRHIISKRVERGPIGELVKRENGYRCQICDALGRSPHAFKKPGGEWYIEAHHVTFVSKQLPGVLSSANVIAVCPNHHRQLHYGDVSMRDDGATFAFQIEGAAIAVPKFVIVAP